MRSVTLSALIAALVLCGCASTRVYRDASSSFVNQEAQASCQKLYGDSDGEIQKISTDFAASYEQRNAFLARMTQSIKDAPKADRHCWQTAYEHHTDYDLFYAEFDDAGRPNDVAHGAVYDQSQLFLIENQLRALLGEGSRATTAAAGAPPQPLDVVVFTHGWHGTARADNDYSVEFKGILLDVASRERAYQQSTRSYALYPTLQSRQQHRVVGIEIAWRGDSFLNPQLLIPGSKNALNVWDRKTAARSLSNGAPQELLAFLNELYLDNSCHGAGAEEAVSAGADCDRMHLLSIGHSFGALINFEALTPRLQSGLSVRNCFRAFGYGDMTVLLNPAFEGSRYRSLFDNAVNRPQLIGPYFDSGHLTDCGGPPQPQQWAGQTGSEVQLPTLVILQSRGDTATGTFFPILQRITTPFQKTLSDTESRDKDLAVGWNPDFRTHLLSPLKQATADQCAGPTTSYCPFYHLGPEEQFRDTHSDRMQLTWDPGSNNLPALMPLWSVSVDPLIMKDHDDFWNPQIIRLVSILFSNAYEQTERLHGGRPSPPPPTASH